MVSREDLAPVPSGRDRRGAHQAAAERLSRSPVSLFERARRRLAVAPNLLLERRHAALDRARVRSAARGDELRGSDHEQRQRCQAAVSFFIPRLLLGCSLSRPAARPRDPRLRRGPALVGRERAELDQLALVARGPSRRRRSPRSRTSSPSPPRPRDSAVPIARPRGSASSARSRRACRRGARARRAGSPRAASGRGARTPPAARRSRGRSASPSASSAPDCPGCERERLAAARRGRSRAPLKMSACAPVGESTPSRSAFARDLLPDRGLRDAALERRALRAARPCAGAARGRRACGADAKCALRACQRPSSTHETGIRVSLRAATSTVTLRIRFCFAPSSSSPS